MYMATKFLSVLSSSRYVVIRIEHSDSILHSLCSCCLSTKNYSRSSAHAQKADDVITNSKDDDHLMINNEVRSKCITHSSNVIPGKGPPPEPPVECCMSGCSNCVWIVYAEELKDYYSDGGRSALKALEMIENPSLKAFVKLELNLK